MRSAALVAVMLAGAGLVACSDDDEQITPVADAAADDEASASDGGDEETTRSEDEDEDEAASSDDGAGEDRGGDEATSDDCAPGPGKTVTQLEDLVIPAVEAERVVVEDTTLAGEPVPGFEVPALRIPQQTVDAGCIVEYEAPGGCLGAVEITGLEIPTVELPGVEIPAVEGSGVQRDRVSREPVRREAVRRDAVRREQVCQREPADGDGYVASVTRNALTRNTLTRNALQRNSLTRSTLCTNADVADRCVDSVTVPGVTVPAVTVEAVTVEAETLDGYLLEGSEAEVFEDEEQTAYLAPADVLFDFDESVLRPDAVPTLEAIVGEIDRRFPDATVTVEGHTDDQGGPDYNQRLSEQRAEAVADWLTTEGGVATDRITTVGYGEEVPVAPNDSEEGRSRNRRVVITVRPG